MGETRGFGIWQFLLRVPAAPRGPGTLGAALVVTQGPTWGAASLICPAGGGQALVPPVKLLYTAGSGCESKVHKAELKDRFRPCSSGSGCHLGGGQEGV